MNNRTYGKCHSYSVVYFFMFFSLSAPKTRTIEFLDKNVRCERSFSVLLISFVLFIVASIAKSKEATIYIWKKNLLIFYSAACGGSCAANWPCAMAFRKSIFTCHYIEPVSWMTVCVCASQSEPVHCGDRVLITHSDGCGSLTRIRQVRNRSSSGGQSVRERVIEQMEKRETERERDS